MCVCEGYLVGRIYIRSRAHRTTRAYPAGKVFWVEAENAKVRARVTQTVRLLGLVEVFRSCGRSTGCANASAIAVMAKILDASGRARRPHIMILLGFVGKL